jgi:hypothetical protein
MRKKGFFPHLARGKKGFFPLKRRVWIGQSCVATPSEGAKTQMQIFKDSDNSAAERAFRGPGYTPDLDRKRLSLQIERILTHTALEERYAPTIFPENSISAQLRIFASSATKSKSVAAAAIAPHVAPASGNIA